MKNMLLSLQCDSGFVESTEDWWVYEYWALKIRIIKNLFKNSIGSSHI